MILTNMANSKCGIAYVSTRLRVAQFLVCTNFFCDTLKLAIHILHKASA
jgi:hypothetical protein